MTENSQNSTSSLNDDNIINSTTELVSKNSQEADQKDSISNTESDRGGDKMDDCDEYEESDIQEQPVTTRREMLAWINYDFSSTVFSSVAMQVFIPLVLEKMAFNAGTQPNSDKPCNQVQQSTDSNETIACDVQFGFMKVPTVSFVLYITAISVICQAFAFISLGALADYGGYRKSLLMIFSFIGSVLTMSFVTITDENQYVLVAIISILANVAYGLTIIFYNAFLSVLVQNHPVLRVNLDDVEDLETLEESLSLFGLTKKYARAKSKTKSFFRPISSRLSAFLDSLRCRNIGSVDPIVLNDIDEPADDESDKNDVNDENSSVPAVKFAEDTKAASIDMEGEAPPPPRRRREPSLIPDLWAKLQKGESQNHEKVYEKLITKLQDKLANTLSTHGLASGHIGSLLMLGITAAIATSVTSTYGSQIAIALCGLWWFSFSFYTWVNLKTRPGPPLPKTSSNYVFFSWKKIFSTMRHYKRLPNTFIYLVAYFIFTDAFTTIGNIAVLFASKTIKMTSAQLAIAYFMAPFFALLGGYMWLWISNKYKWTTKKTLMVLLSLSLVLPIYGLLGYINIGSQIEFVAADKESKTPAIALGFGLTSVVELYIAVILFASLVGAISSYGRVLYTDLLPIGREAEFFALYTITDRGTSWIGPLVVGAISSGTNGDLRMGFVYVLATLIIGIVLLYFVDAPKGRKDCALFYIEEQEAERQAVEKRKMKKLRRESKLSA